MTKRRGDRIVPDLPDPSEVVQQVKPSLRSFLRGRFFSLNGIAAALYLAFSVWVYRNPRRARVLWDRLQGRRSTDTD